MPTGQVGNGTTLRLHMQLRRPFAIEPGLTAWISVAQAGGAKNSRAMPSGSRKETPEP